MGRNAIMISLVVIVRLHIQGSKTSGPISEDSSCMSDSQSGRRMRRCLRCFSEEAGLANALGLVRRDEGKEAMLGGEHGIETRPN